MYNIEDQKVQLVQSSVGQIHYMSLIRSTTFFGLLFDFMITTSKQSLFAHPKPG